MKKLNISSAKVLKHGYKFYSKWEDFVKNNKKLIDTYVNKEIKESLKVIKDEKQREKLFKRDMEDYKTDLTHTWNEMKKRKKVSIKLPKRQLENAVKVMQLYLGALDRTRLVDQQNLYKKINDLVKKIADTLGMSFEDVWSQIEGEAKKRGKIIPKPGKDY